MNHRPAPERCRRTAQQLLVALCWLVASAAQLGWAQSAASTSPCAPDTCMVQQFASVRSDTETLYGDVLRILSAHERPALRENQGAWRRTARQHCQESAPVGDDPQAPAASRHHFCMIEQDMQRRNTLRKWLMSGYSVD